MKISQKQQRQLNKILKENNIVLAYIFGSFTQDKTGPLSDLDIAILFSKEVSENEYFNRELKLSSRMGSLFKINRVDVINLKTVNSPLLKHNAVFEGKIIFGENSKNRFELEKRIMQEYEDTKHLRSIQNKIMNEQIRIGAFGKPQISIHSKFIDKRLKNVTR